MKTKLEKIINKCEKDDYSHNCKNCLCDEGECLENLLDIYNANKSKEDNI